MLLGFPAQNHPQQQAADYVDDRATDPQFWAQLDMRFSFTIDVAASAENARHPRYYTADDDGLAQSWSGYRVWCNPPYSDIAPWIVKAWHSDAELVVMLLPANRTEQAWWQDLVEPYRDRGRGLSVEFLRGRLRFLRPGERIIGPNRRPPFGCCLAIWTGPIEPPRGVDATPPSLGDDT